MQPKTIVIGGGLAGLTAARYLQGSGLSVTVLERSQRIGGRAHTTEHGEFRLNMGPHALYLGGAAPEVLEELDIPIDGGIVSTNQGAYAVRNSELYTLPLSAKTILTTRALSFGEKVGVVRSMSEIFRLDPTDYHRVTIRDWIWGVTESARVREYLLAALRLATYTNAPDEQSMDHAIRQLKNTNSGIMYLNTGWSGLVDALAEGLNIMTGVRVESVVIENRRVQGVKLVDGKVLPADGVVVAVGPQQALSIVPDAKNSAWGRYAANLKPVQAAILDIALDQLPDPNHVLGLGLDEPTYYSVHSNWAPGLAAPKGATIHVAKYLKPDTSGTREDLDAVLNLMQPGWRAHVVTERFLPNITVMNGMVRAADNGLAGRPSPIVDEIQGLTLAGDWVSEAGILVEPVMYSARVAARHIIETVALPIF